MLRVPARICRVLHDAMCYVTRYHTTRRTHLAQLGVQVLRGGEARGDVPLDAVQALGAQRVPHVKRRVAVTRAHDRRVDRVEVIDAHLHLGDHVGYRIVGFSSFSIRSSAAGRVRACTVWSDQCVCSK